MVAPRRRMSLPPGFLEACLVAAAAMLAAAVGAVAATPATHTLRVPFSQAKVSVASVGTTVDISGEIIVRYRLQEIGDGTKTLLHYRVDFSELKAVTGGHTLRARGKRGGVGKGDDGRVTAGIDRRVRFGEPREGMQLFFRGELSVTGSGQPVAQLRGRFPEPR